jgi:hypothetical protein
MVDKMANKYSDITKYSELKPAVEQVLQEQVDKGPSWKYVKSKHVFVFQVSKSMHVEIPTGFSSKATFINFQFGIRIIHKSIKKVSEKLGHRKPFSDLMLFRDKTRFIPEEYNRGSCTVCLPNTSEIFDHQHQQGNTGYVYLSEFPQRLATIFDLAENEIGRLFDLSSEEALVQSIVAHPMGTFRGHEVLLIQLMLGNLEYYDKLLQFYDQPAAELWQENQDGFNLNEGFRKDVGEKLMDIYKEGDFPTFSFS